MRISAEVWGFAGSIIVGILTMIGVIYSAKSTKDANDAVVRTQMENIGSQIKVLDEKQSKYNNVIERTFLLEKNQAETSRDIKTLYNNLDEVKSDVKEVRNDIDNLNNNINEVKETEIRLEEKINNHN